MRVHSSDADAETGRPAALAGAAVAGLVVIALLYLFALVNTALVVVLELPSDSSATPVLGLAYLGLFSASVLVAAGLIHRPTARLWIAAGAVAAVPLVASLVSHTIGFPGAADDLGDWDMSITLASLLIEGFVLAVSVRGWHLTRRAPGRLHRRATARAIPTMTAPAR